MVTLPTQQHYLMCRPTHFAVTYEINPWMDSSVPVDSVRALAQWSHLVDTLLQLGHDVQFIDPEPGLPDMVYAANGATIIRGVAYTTKFRHRERRGETAAFQQWFLQHGYQLRIATSINEGQGDFLLAGNTLFIGYGPRTERSALAECETLLNVATCGLRLVSPEFYHLDTSLLVLRGGGTTPSNQDVEIAYYPEAFDPESQDLLRDIFPDAITVSEADARAFGLNAVSDGHHVVMPAQATRLNAQLRERGYSTIPLDLSELLRGGGGIKCCTLDIGTVPSPTESTSTTLTRNYSPLPVTVSQGQGSWVTDTQERRYLDLLAGYSAVNFGHVHPDITAAAHRQLDRVTLTSRAFQHEGLAPFADRLAGLIGPLTTGGVDNTAVLPMNTGAEAVETAIKAARKWGYHQGKDPENLTIIVAGGNFHGRTTTIVSFSDDPDSREGFGPYAPGFTIVPFGDIDAATAAITNDTAAIMMEPIQGESGVIIPPPDYWPALRRLCDQHGILLIADEIQSGLGRTGTTLACELWNVSPDVVTLGKALGGGVLPVSAVVGRADILDVFTPGTHGSTFGGNPLACAVAMAALTLLETGTPQLAAQTLGVLMQEHMTALVAKGLAESARTIGAWTGLDLTQGTGRQFCEALLIRGVLAKETHGATLRLAPPLTTSPTDLRWGLDTIRNTLETSGPWHQ